jgi:hypothetical protein
MALFASALFHILPDCYTRVQGDCAVSLRHFLSPHVAHRDMGCWVGSFSQSYSRFEDSVWDNAKKTKITINDAVKGNGADMAVGYLRHVPDMAAWFRSKIGKRRPAAWELSNVGALAPREEGETVGCEIENLLFSQSASACSGAIKLSVATGRDWRLGLGFTWQDGVVETELVHQLIDKFFALLEIEIQDAES